MQAEQPSREQLLLEIERLRQELEDLKRDKADLEILLETTTEHSDTVEAELQDRAESALKESAERFQLIAEATPVPVLISRLSDGAIVYANTIAGSTFGLPNHELLNCRFQDFCYDSSDSQELLNTFARDGDVLNYELQCKRTDGTPFWVTASLRSLIYNGQSTILSALCDITNRTYAEAALKNAKSELEIRVEQRTAQLRASNEQLQAQIAERQRIEEALRASEAELRALFAAMTDVILVLDRQGRCLRVAPTNSSPAIQPKAEQINKTLHEVLPADVVEMQLSFIQRALDTQQTLNVEYSLMLDNQEMWFSANISALSENTVLWVARDITKRKRAESALQEKEQYLRLILDNIPQQVFWKDTDLVFLGCNKNWAKAAQIDNPEAVVGKTDYDLLPSREIAEQFRARDRRVIETNMPEFHVVETKQKIANGQPVWLDVNKIPIHDSEGKVIGVLGVLEDITQRKLAEEALRVEQEKSERLLLNILPGVIAEQLKQNQNILTKQNGGVLIAEQFEEATILFADIVNFTHLASEMSATELVKLLNQIFSIFDQLAEQYGLEKIKTIGDAYMVAGGLPMPRKDHAEAVAEMALEMQRQITRFHWDNGEPFRLRIGINTGPVVAGVIGLKKFIYDLWGDTVNVASRMESQGMPGAIQVTNTTYQHLQDKYLFDRRDKISVKGKGEMVTYWLTDRKMNDTNLSA